MKRGKIARWTLLAVCLVLVTVLAATIKTIGQEESKRTDAVAKEQWEYLVVANASRTNFTPTGNPRMRKEPGAAFGIEGFVLEQHLDKLGANGWELVAVAGVATDPIYYFKKRK